MRDGDGNHLFCGCYGSLQRLNPRRELGQQCEEDRQKEDSEVDNNQITLTTFNAAHLTPIKFQFLAPKVNARVPYWPLNTSGSI